MLLIRIILRHVGEIIDSFLCSDYYVIEYYKRVHVKLSVRGHVMIVFLENILPKVQYSSVCLLYHGMDFTYLPILYYGTILEYTPDSLCTSLSQLSIPTKCQYVIILN